MSQIQTWLHELLPLHQHWVTLFQGGDPAA